MDYEGLYEAFMAGIETALPGGGTVLGGLRAVDQNPVVRRLNEDVNYAKGEVGNMAGQAASDLGGALSSALTENVFADYGAHLRTGLPTKAITSIRKAPRTMHPEAAAILKQVTGQQAPEEEQTNELELTKDLLDEITSGRRVVGKNDKLKSRPGQKGFSRGGKGYQPAEDPRISAARIRAGSERQKNNSAAFAGIMAAIAKNPDISPENAAVLARTLLRGGQPLDDLNDAPDVAPAELTGEDRSDVVAKLKTYGLSAAAIAALLVGGKYARGKFGKAAKAAEGVVKKEAKALPLGEVPKGLGYNPKIRGGNPARFPATPETINVGGRLGLPAPQGTPTPQVLRSTSGAIHLGDEQLKNLVNEAVRTGKLPDSRYLAEILRNRNKYSDEADKLIEMLDLRRGFRVK